MKANPETVLDNSLAKNPSNPSIPPIVSDAVEAMPESMRKEIYKELQMSFEFMQNGMHPENPIIAKMSPEHISDILKINNTEMLQEFKYKSSNRWFLLGIITIGVALFIFLVVYLADKHNAILMDILKIACGFIGGLGSGFALKSRNKKEE